MAQAVKVQGVQLFWTFALNQTTWKDNFVNSNADKTEDISAPADFVLAVFPVMLNLPSIIFGVSM